MQDYNNNNNQNYNNNIQQQDIVDDWKIETSTETDLDGLKECILRGNDNDTSIIRINIMDQLAQSLLDDCQVHNWRQLANCQAVDIHSKLVGNTNVTMDMVDSWIDTAQTKSLEEIIMELCDSNDEAVVALREAARSGTPKDLAAWSSIASLLHSELQGYYLNNNHKSIQRIQSGLILWCIN
jgi:hypothetical protein